MCVWKDEDIDKYINKYLYIIKLKLCAFLGFEHITLVHFNSS